MSEAMSGTHRPALLAALAALFIATAGSVADAQSAAEDAAEAMENIEWRAIGPANMGGRVTDIDGAPGDPSTFYVSGADGGVFRTTNGGVTFDELFTKEKSYSVGALTLAPSDPNVLWLGSGEGDPRNSVSYGHGVYRSNDAGDTWTHLGLDKTERIKRIVVHPDDPDTALVCALGRQFGPNKERGVFRTTDGGESWEKVLYIDKDTGCSDIDMELSNPRIIYAGMWTFRRKPWRFDDGDGETALYRSKDGGTTWEKLDGEGMPEGPMARIGVSIAQGEPSVVYLMTETKDEGSLFRSDDRGETWRMVNDDRDLNFRPFYYSDIHVDPNDADHLYSLSGRLFKSTDGGISFERIAEDVHGDHQSFWIDPANSKRLLSGSDGGYQLSFDAGSSWDIINNVELSQFYQLYVDGRDPYFVCGGLQDNGTWCGPSNSLREAGILKRDWVPLAYGDGYFAVPIPGDERYAYATWQGGGIYLVDSETGSTRSIHPYPKIVASAGDAIAEHKYRFNWDAGFSISPHDPETVYFGGNVVFRSKDRGNSWEVISDDLTNNDKSKQASSGGSVYQDNTAAEFHNTILYIDESPVKKGVIWVGTDDGNLHITRDDGKTWTNVRNNVDGLPEFAWISKIHASEHEAGTAFVTVDHHRSDDYAPYVFVTTDFGESWKSLAEGLPQDDYVKVVRQDPSNPDVLFAGMEHGIYISLDRGETWASIANNLPPVSVRDLRVHPLEGDLIVGTHGRGAWILDDIRPLQDWNGANVSSVHLFPVRDATRWHLHTRLESQGTRRYRAPNPEYGAFVNLYVAEAPEEPISVTIRNSDGDTVRVLDEIELEEGVNRIVWDLRHDAATAWKNAPTEGWGDGEINVLALPGKYTASVEVDGRKLRSSFEIKADQRFDLSEQGYSEQSIATLALRDLLSETHVMLNNVDSTIRQLGELEVKLGEDENAEENDEMSEMIAAALDEATEVRALLTRPAPAMMYRDKPRLREEIRTLMRDIDGAVNAPTVPQSVRLAQLSDETKEATGAYKKLMEGAVAEINSRVESMPHILISAAD
jgi:photosystem II stability/assembly factor-like uncharacterized protein